MPTKDELKQLQSLPLDMKIWRTKQRIREWVNHYGENGVYVSFSGGKDSTVLLHIVREMYPEIEAVFVNTGLEYPEIQAFVKTFPNVRILYPKRTFKQVLSEKGYPIISKEVSHAVSVAKRVPCGKYATEYFNGSKGMYDYSRYKPLIDMDFMIDNRCCNIMKKEPTHRYGKESGKVPITAQMACESRLRKYNWLINGCNAFDVTNPISNPMSFWAEQDILMYIKAHNIKICSVYGEIVYDCEDPDQERFSDATTLPLKTTGLSRTGCIYCAYGCHHENGETRFQRLARTHPKQYNYCIRGGARDPTDGLWKPTKEGLGLGYVFDRINEIYGENFIRYKPDDQEVPNVK